MSQSAENHARLIALAIEFSDLQTKGMLYQQLWKNTIDRMQAIAEEVKMLEAMATKPQTDSVN